MIDPKITTVLLHEMQRQCPNGMPMHMKMTYEIAKVMGSDLLHWWEKIFLSPERIAQIIANRAARMAYEIMIENKSMMAQIAENLSNNQ